MEKDEHMPQHIAIILDGNGRWAKLKGLTRSEGHKKGSETVKKIVDYSDKIGIKYITLYAFSTENWQRPKSEVDEIMKLLDSYLDESQKYADKNAKIVILGDVSKLDIPLRKKIKETERLTAKNTGITVNIAINYGGRQEIIEAAKKVASLAAIGEIEINDITPSFFENFLYTKEQPSPDFVLRPGGEQRLSNFLLWQSAYSELIFSSVLWPDFTTDDLDLAIAEFKKRNRRFGGI
ncbi:MAG: polyprenyl diphosphate synthase [Oscillospiraceae bacterium]